MDVLNITKTEPFTILVNGEEKLLSFNLYAVIEIEKRLARPMKSATDWFRLEVREMRDVLAVGLSKHNEDAETLADAIIDTLDLESVQTLIDAVCAANFPKTLAKLDVFMAQLKTTTEKPIPVA